MDPGMAGLAMRRRHFLNYFVSMSPRVRPWHSNALASPLRLERGCRRWPSI
jgi:hypothetical protein